ncbi:7-cyano-7-deazaguanine synthase QueC [bacterium]|nr:7-cyano-7-deazaguanine synthase QueC [bacterium]
MTNGIILLSGGLDSLVSLGLSKEQYGISLALTFDYGQKSVKKEIETSKIICDYYKIEHKIIKLDWLREITHTALVSKDMLPEKIDENSAKNVWVPNRNGLFLNIAGAFADGENYDYIIIGANKEEAENFPDNTKDFIERINSEFEFSTQKCPKVVAPLLNCDKNDIVKLALEHSIPLQLVFSCYAGNEKHCGKCESCIRLKNALIANNATNYLKELF